MFRDLSCRLLIALFIVGLLSVDVGAKPPSASVGDATHGSLEHAKALAKKTSATRVLTATVRRQFYYGTDRLVGAIVDAAKTVRQKMPKSVLRIGNLSRKAGGDIPQSRSHNSGRDADLAFYVVDQKGRAANPDTLVKFPRRAAEKMPIRAGKWTFDVERNWLLLTAFMENSNVEIDWVFAARWLIAALLDHAAERGALPSLVLRAETSLKQPGDSSPHADHFHVRVYCTARERDEHGCVNYGYVWPWVDAGGQYLQGRAAEELAKALDTSASTKLRKRALYWLVKHRVGQAVDWVVHLASEPDLRAPIVSLVAATGSDAAVAALADALEATGGLRASEAIRLSKRASASALCAPLAAAMANTSNKRKDRLKALTALVRLGRPCAVEALADRWNDRNKRVAEAAREALETTVNRRFDTRRAFERWWAETASRTPSEWVRQGFVEAGVLPPSGDLTVQQEAKALLNAVDLDPPVGLNAQRALRKLLGRGRDTSDWPASKTRKYWSSLHSEVESAFY